jgi:adenine phosphoribosyltransferase
MSAIADRMKQLILDVPDFPKPGIVFKDLTPVFLDPAASKALIDHLADRYRGQQIEAIAAIESRGFLIGAPLALALGVGLVLVRKPGKLPRPTLRRSYALEYGNDTLEMHKDAVRPGGRVVVIDDLLATGGTAGAVVGLLQEARAEVVEATFLVELGFLGGRAKLAPTSIYSVLSY